ncbi:uncharacterized protein BCR38DRAFT_329982 [Pseudomassariella vexata]|uniref:rRNA biogenesis protein RRP36 n=1 Tax=Pseudomassariella vexata TaxID=1141098 RepID=A0A1Y2EJ42_9PEZI|nr:uncharacterized protein BCR38DRAFT_329982 [Pseudomassariella vexata]ORY71256.1 hypothetical protein BCR38DRAFT_329982 [Pseudomassariella vexata]
MGPSKSSKRKLPFSGLQRRVRARKEEPEPEEIIESSEGSEDEDEDASDNEDESQSDASSDEDEYKEDAEPTLDPSQISFGELAKVQASLPPRKGRRKTAPSDSGSGSGSESGADADEAEATTTYGYDPKRTFKPVQGRSSKHAPAEQTSKRAVTRKREVVPVHKPTARDPRFGPLGAHGPPSEDAVRKNYSFLSEYRDAEIATLRATIKKTKDPRAKEELQRALISMQSKKLAQQRKDEARAVLEEHRKQEKEAVKQGKKPFYLKKAEQKKQVLVKRFEGLKKRDVDKAIERKRKKIVSKEKKDLPWVRRER